MSEQRLNREVFLPQFLGIRPQISLVGVVMSIMEQIW